MDARDHANSDRAFAPGIDEGHEKLTLLIPRTNGRMSFAVVDQAGVGQLMEIAVSKGRSTRKNIKLGICGEHGGEPGSVKFCHSLGLNYVSCSPFRVPVARLAAAQAAMA